MDNKTYILAIFAFSMTFLGQAEANVNHENFGNRFEGLNVLKMGPLDPRDEDNTPPLPNDGKGEDVAQ